MHPGVISWNLRPAVAPTSSWLRLTQFLHKWWTRPHKLMQPKGTEAIMPSRACPCGWAAKRGNWTWLCICVQNSDEQHHRNQSSKQEKELHYRIIWLRARALGKQWQHRYRIRAWHTAGMHWCGRCCPSSSCHALRHSQRCPPTLTLNTKSNGGWKNAVWGTECGAVTLGNSRSMVRITIVRTLFSLTLRRQKKARTCRLGGFFIPGRSR